MSKKYPHSVNELPNEEFFAILTTNSVTIPGDERSRTNPGHGYPESTQHYWEMQVYSTEQEWKEEVIRLEKQTGAYRTQFKAIRAIPAKITTEVKVKVQ